MSTPYSPPPAAPQPSDPPQPARDSPDLGSILALAAAAFGLAIYFCNFADSALGIQGPLMYLFLAAGLLSAAALLPKAPPVLVPAAVLSATGMLGTLNVIVLVPGAPTIVIAMLVLGVLQTASLIVAALVSAGIVRMRPKPRPFSQQPWGPPSGGFPTQPGQYQPGPGGPGQYPPGQYGQPGQYGPQPGQYGPQPGQAAPGQYGQPGQYGAQPEQGEATLKFGPLGRQGPGGQGPGGQGPDDQPNHGPKYGSPDAPRGGGQGPGQS